MSKALAGLLLVALSTTLRAGTPAEENAALAAVGVSQRIGEPVPLNLQFTDQRGERVSLAALAGGRPALLELAWYDCPSLCDLSLRRLGSSIAGTDYAAGRDYAVIVVSIDPHEPRRAVRKVDALLAETSGNDRDGAWHVLTGDAASIRALADSIGFHYRYDAASKQFAHPAGLAVMDGDGGISSYLLGLSYTGRDVQLALTRAGRGELGSVAAQFVLRCFHFDPQTGRYTLDVLRIVNVACIVTAILLAAGIAVMLRRKRHSARARGSAS